MSVVMQVHPKAAWQKAPEEQRALLGRGPRSPEPAGL